MGTAIGRGILFSGLMENPLTKFKFLTSRRNATKIWRQPIHHPRSLGKKPRTSRIRAPSGAWGGVGTSALHLASRQIGSVNPLGGTPCFVRKPKGLGIILRVPPLPQRGKTWRVKQKRGEKGQKARAIWQVHRTQQKGFFSPGRKHPPRSLRPRDPGHVFFRDPAFSPTQSSRKVTGFPSSSCEKFPKKHPREKCGGEAPKNSGCG